MAAVNITKKNFEQEVLAEKLPVVLEFWADWCETSRTQAEIIASLEEVAQGKVKAGRVNVDEEAALALNYQIMSVPTIIVMKDGIFRERAAGLQEKDALQSMIKRSSSSTGKIEI